MTLQEWTEALSQRLGVDLDVDLDWCSISLATLRTTWSDRRRP